MLIDRLIGYFSPKAEAKRIRYRKAVEVLSRKYEGASRSRRTQNWHASNSSANAENQNAIEILRNRSRDLVRNNPYGARFISVISNNTVGKGIIPNIISPTEALSTRHTKLWERWAENPKFFDVDGRHTFYSMQALLMKSVVESGEVIVRLVRSSSDDAPIPFKVQILESDHLPTERFFMNPVNENKIIQGIEVDGLGKAIAYHLYESHPGSLGIDTTWSKTPFRTVRVPADQVAHVFKLDRPGQLRGVPWLAPAMLRLRDLDEFEDAELVRQKVAACFAAFIEDMEPPNDISTSESKEFDLEKLEPGIIEHLPPGKKITFGTPPPTSMSGYQQFTASILRAAAAGVGVSYEALTGDLSQVNFSSARMGWLEFQRNIDCWREHIVIPSYCEKVFSWFKEGATLMGERVDGTYASWITPRREMIDPTKEVPAKIKSIRAGLETLSEAIRAQGKDPDDHFNEIKADNDKLTSLGLILDSDPRNTNTQGAVQESSDSSVMD